MIGIVEEVAFLGRSVIGEGGFRSFGGFRQGELVVDAEGVEVGGGFVGSVPVSLLLHFV